ncbi:MAG: histidine phosphatase family protein [Bryobacteraceae bacterium]|nr:histidine phosphatase family protein [Bryobacteraceae bacterium]
MRLYLVRHAEPTLAGRFIGRTDPPLSDNGRTQAAALVSLQVDQVYVSPLQRAQQTAAFIAAPQTTLDELAELHFGDWEGLTWAEIAARDPELAERKLANWFSVPAPNGETLAELLVRLGRALEKIPPQPRVAIVAHAVVNGALRSLLTGGDPASYRQQYAEVIEIET